MASTTRWLFRVMVGVLAALAVATAGIYLASAWRLRKKWKLPAEVVTVPTDSAAIAYGEHVAEIHRCQGCHGPDLSGASFIDAAGVLKLWARNLTSGRGGSGATYTDGDWVRAIRHGVAANGRGLVFMPSQNYQRLNDHDLGALIAWLKSRPPVDAEYPASSVGLIGRILFLKGALPLVPAEQIDHAAPRAPAVPIGLTIGYGEYLAGGCRGCHGETFSGGMIPGGFRDLLPARNLTPDNETGIGRWTLDEFRTALRTGMLPGGVQMDTLAMPVAMSRHFTDEESEALFLYFLTLPAKAYGNR